MKTARMVLAAARNGGGAESAVAVGVNASSRLA
jgi:hypothetical protein